jgi:sugar lactone lactonase YvrE
VLAHVPPPGYPALSLVAPDRTIYVGTFTNATGEATGPSHLYAYSPDGLMLRDWTIKGQNPDGNNGIQVAAQDANGVLYLLDQQPPRVLAFDPHTGRQSTYATFTDVPSCGSTSGNCSATVIDNPPEPDYAAWGTDGSLYVTDYTQGLIWRVPPGGGQAHVWFTDPKLDGTMFGPAGIVMMPDHKTLMLSTSAGGATSIGNPTSGKLYTLPIRSDGSPGALEQIWESGPAQGPDGFALATSGNVYMALVGPGTNQLVEISPDGKELGRTPATPLDNQMMTVPFDGPSSVQFDGERMIVTNDAFFSGDQSHWVLFDVWAGEPGAPVYVPGR